MTEELDHNVAYAVDDGVATITFSRESQRNAVSAGMVFAAMRALDRSDADPEVRAVVLTGAGPTFCVGADLSSGSDRFGSSFDRIAERSGVAGGVDSGQFREPGGLLAERILASHRPVIAAVNGDAAGMGATILCAVDARVAADDARIGFVFTRRGLTLEAGASWFLPRLIGMPVALDWTMSGRLVPAAEALAAGFVESIHPRSELPAAARAVADRFTAGTSPASMAMTRRLLWAASTLPTPTDAHEVESRLVAHRSKSDDGREGVNAFLERREAQFNPIVEGQIPEWLPTPWRS